MSENKTPTARQILNKYKSRDLGLFNKDIEEAMIEFGKLHVEAALKAAAEKAITEKPKEQTQPITWNNVSPDDYNYFDVDKDSILNAYPLENIK